MALATLAAWMTAAGVLAREWDSPPDAKDAPRLLQKEIDEALRAAARRMPPLSAGATSTAATNVPGTLPGGWLVRYVATVGATQEFKVGARGDVKEPVPSTAHFESSVTVSTRWQRVVALLGVLLSLTACAAWARFGRGYDAFVCYDNRDLERVLEVVVALEACGSRLCMDKRGAIVAGDDWKIEVARHLRDMPAALLFLGRDALGEYQAWEANLLVALARAGRCRVIGVRLPGTMKVPDELNRYSRVEIGDGEGPSGDAATVRKLLEALDRGGPAVP